VRLRPILAAAVAVGLASLAWAGAVAPSAGAAPAFSAQPAGKHAARVCAQAVTGASCLALRLDPATSAAGVSPAAATPSGLFPADLQSAYKLPSGTAGAGRTIAIVDAFDDPAAESDLGVYRSQFGLPACTTADVRPGRSTAPGPSDPTQAGRAADAPPAVRPYRLSGSSGAAS
jgi:hypothetical protein